MNFFEKLSSLHPAVQFYFGNKISIDFIEIIVKKYSDLRKEEVERLVRNFITSDFDVKKIIEEITADFNNDKTKTDIFLGDFLGIIFYPISAFLANKNIVEEIKNTGAFISSYEVYKNRFESEIIGEEEKIMREFLSSMKKNLNIEEEYASTMDIFENNLIDLLKDKDYETVDLINNGIYILLNNKKDFQDAIVKVLSDNKQELFEKEFLLEGKKSESTVCNWLKDFILNEGGGMFNELALSRFLTSSVNVKKLDKEERNLLRKLLVSYRNIKFFPRSMENVPPEKWEFIPTEKEEELSKVKKTSPKTASTPQPPLSGGQDEKLKELREMADSFPVGSLERKAIEEEINKLK